MAKVTITVTDGDNGMYSVVAVPSAREMANLLAAGEATAAHKASMITMKMLQKILAEVKHKRIMVPGHRMN